MQLTMTQRQKALFKFKVVNGILNLYDGVDNDNLRFLSQVVIKDDLPQAIQNAVNKVYDSMTNPISPLLYSVEDTDSKTIINGEYLDKSDSRRYL